MGDDSGAEEAEGELELLRSMYEDEDLTVEEGPTVTVSLVLVPAVEARVTTTIVAQLPPGYPRTKPPAVSFTRSRGLSDTDIAKLGECVAQEIEDSAGATCLFQAIEAARGVLDGCNFSDTQHTCAICLQQAAAAGTFTPPCFHSFHRSCLGRWVDQLHNRRMASSSVRGQANAVNARLRAAQGDAENRKALVQRLHSEASAVGKQLRRADARLKQLHKGADLREGESLSAVASLVGDLGAKAKRLERKVTSAQARVAESTTALERAQARAHAALERQRSEQLVVPCPVCRKPIEACDADELRSAWRAANPEAAAAAEAAAALAASRTTASRGSVASGAGGSAGAGASSGSGDGAEGSWGGSDDDDSSDEAGSGGGAEDSFTPEDVSWLREYVEFQRAREAELVRQAQKIHGRAPTAVPRAGGDGTAGDDVGSSVLVVGSRGPATAAAGDVSAGKENLHDADVCVRVSGGVCDGRSNAAALAADPALDDGSTTTSGAAAGAGTAAHSCKQTAVGGGRETRATAKSIPKGDKSAKRKGKKHRKSSKARHGAQAPAAVQ